MQGKRERERRRAIHLERMNKTQANKDRSGCEPDRHGVMLADDEPADERRQKLGHGLYGLVDAEYLPLAVRHRQGRK